MSASNDTRYTFGVDMAAPRNVYLTIHTEATDLDQFRADLPRIVATLESCITNAKDEATRDSA